MKLSKTSNVNSIQKVPGQVQNHPEVSRSKTAQGVFSKKKTLYATIIACLVVIVTSSGLLVYSVANREHNDDGNTQDNEQEVGSKPPGTQTPEKPELVVSPINGGLIPRQEFEKLKDRPPLAVIVQNNPEARPPHGLQQADVVYEMTTESHITRFMPIYWSQDSKDRVMSVRSARKFQVDLLGDYGDPLFFHEGYATGATNVNALSAIYSNKVKSLGLTKGGLMRDSACARTKSREHCAYSTTEHLWELGQERYPDMYNNAVSEVESWKFGVSESDLEKNKLLDPKTLEELQVSPVSTSLGRAVKDFTVDFGAYEVTYGVNWKYDEAQSSYRRFNYNGKPYNDNEGNQLATDIVILQQVKSYPTGDFKGHWVHNVIGSGEGWVMMNGHAFPVTWKKENYSQRTKFYNPDGSEFVFRRGKIWVQVIDDDLEYINNQTGGDEGLGGSSSR